MLATIDLNALGFVLENAWVVPFLPFVSFLFCGLLGRSLGEKANAYITTSAVFASGIWAYMVAYEYYHLFPHGTSPEAIVPFAFRWLPFQENLIANFGVLLDPISVLLIVVVTTVSAMVHLYSIGYLHGEEGYRRYFVFLNLFTFTMLGLVVAPNIIQTFVCWEGVGICSFLLIGFYYQKPSAVSASKKAFIVTRFADLGFLVGMIILGFWGYESFSAVSPAIQAELGGHIPGHLAIQPFDYMYLNHEKALEPMTQGSTFLGMNTLTWALILIFMGAAGKSAMFPLHIWLPDAMEGPTPVSALIHAATMVVAGVYLVARLFGAYAFDHALGGGALQMVAYVGAFTCLFAAIIGCTQDDIKRVLAFSTLSQLGYMMFALGVATWDHSLGFTASMFHLYTHAFFKSLLFLAAGSVIHAVHSNEIWDMGGLRKKMPVTHITFLLATLAIAGVPPLAGFFSKDEILAAAHHNHHNIIYFIGLAVAGITAFYMFRIYFITFWGKHRTEKAEHAHEAPAVMYIPLIVLAALAVGSGWVPMAEYVHTGAPLEHHGIDWSVAGLSIGVGLIGIFLAWFFYAASETRAAAAMRALGPVYIVIKRKFYIDELYLFVTHKIIFRFVARPIAWFDRNVVDGGVNLSGWFTRTSGAVLSVFQTGQVQTYGGWMISGLIFVLLFIWVCFI